MLFNEPKLLKFRPEPETELLYFCFWALHRAEIAEIDSADLLYNLKRLCFSALQRAEIAEMW